MRITADYGQETPIATLLLKKLSFVARSMNDGGRAARLFGAIKSILVANPERASALKHFTEELPFIFETKLKTTIGAMFSTYQANFEIEWQEDRAMSMEEAIDELRSTALRYATGAAAICVVLKVP